MSAKKNLRLASFDGGGIRCFSQLRILESIMHRLRFDKYPDDPDRVMRPHEHFDLMGGSEAGGLLVIMFVKLHLSVEEAMEEFDTIYESVYADASLSPQQRSARLRECLINLLQSYGMKPDGKLISDQEQSCTGLVLAASAVDVTKRVCFRTSPIRSQITSDITVVDAVMATCASQPGFIPLSFGKGYRKQTYVAVSAAFCNPSREVVMEAQSLFGDDAKVASILSLGSGHPGPIAISTATGSDTVDQALQAMLSSYEQRAQEIEEQFGELGVYCRLSVSQGMQSLQQDLSWISTQTDAFLADMETVRKVDSLTKGLSSGLGVISLDALARLGRSKIAYKEEPMQAIHYVHRQGPRRAIVSAITAPSGEQKIVIVSGMAGCGKTQLITDIVKEYRLGGSTTFKYVFFVDGSSEQTIDKDLVSHVKRVRSDGRSMDADDARSFLCDPANAEWMLAIDNVDIVGAELSDHLPRCNHGVVLVTTRNQTLGMLASKPNFHVILDVMSQDESVEVIRRCASLRSSTPAEDQSFEFIAEKLGYLPVALSQAGYYMQETGCSILDYLGLIKQSMRQQMERPAQNRQHDCAYATFDVTYKRLTPQMQDLVHILSHYHFADFPLSVAAHAAKKLFADDPFPFEPRGVEFEEAIDILKKVFIPNGEWCDATLHELAATMRKFSLASFTFTPLTKLVRQHPLFREWAYDRIPPHRQLAFRQAACRLLACCADNSPLTSYLSPHVDVLISRIGANSLSINEKAMFAKILRLGERLQDARVMWLEIHEVLLANYGSESLHLATASIELANTFDESTLKDMEHYELEAIRIRKSVLGDTHLDTLEALRNLAGTYSQQGRHTEANAIFTPVIAQLQERVPPNDPYMFKINNHIAWVHKAQKEMEIAESLQLKMLNEAKIRLGENHLDTLDLMENLGMTYYEQGKYLEAEKLQVQVLDERKLQLGEGHKNTIYAMSWLAHTYDALTRYTDVVDLCIKVVEWRRTKLGEDHEHTIIAMGQLARAYQSLKRYVEATDLHIRRIEWWTAKYGEEHEYTVNVKDWLARAYYEQARYTEAADLWTQVLEYRTTKLGEDHEHTIYAMYWLALVYHQLARYSEAADLRTKVLEWRRAKLDEDHGETITAMDQLAQTYQMQARYAEAADLWVQVLGHRKAKLGEDHEHTTYVMGCLAMVYHELARYSEAAELRAKVLEWRREKLGESHEETITAMEKLAQTYRMQTRYAEAADLWARVLEHRKTKLGEDHEHTTYAMYWLALVYHELARYSEAADLRAKLLEWRRENLGDGHEETIAAVEKLAQTYRMQARYAEAADLWVQVMEHRKGKLGEDHEHTILAMEWLALVYHELARYSEAAELRAKVLEWRKAELGEHHEETIAAVEKLAQTFQVQARYREAVDLRVKVMEWRTAKLGEDHEHTLWSMVHAGLCYYHLEEYAKAEALDARAYAIRSRNGDESQQMRRVIQDLAWCRLKLDRREEATQLALKMEKMKREAGEVDDAEYKQAVHLLSTLDVHPPYP